MTFVASSSLPQGTALARWRSALQNRLVKRFQFINDARRADCWRVAPTRILLGIFALLLIAGCAARGRPYTAPTASSDGAEGMVPTPTSRPSLSAAAQAYLDALLRTKNTNGHWVPAPPVAPPDVMRELEQGGYLKGIAIDQPLLPTND